MQKVVWSDTIVEGGKHKALRLPQPEAYEGFYEDISLFALPIKEVPDEMPARITCVNIAMEEHADSPKAVNMLSVLHILVISSMNTSVLLPVVTLK